MTKYQIQSQSEAKWLKEVPNKKKKVHSLCENIQVIINLTEKSTASCDYCDENNESN